MKESEILRQIIDWLTAKRIFWFRLNTAAFKVDQRFFKAHSLGKGAADILALEDNGRGGVQPVWIEVKNETGRQRPEQKTFQEMVESHGHTYILARSYEDVARVLGEQC